MKVWRAILTGAVIGGTVAGCGSGLTGTSSPSSQPVASSAPVSSNPPAAAVFLQSSAQVVFAGDTVALTVQESAGTGGSQWTRLAGATVSFGDGSTASASAACTGGSLPAPGAGLVIRHVYHRPGAVNARVTAVSSCTQQAQPDLTGATASMRVLPSASVASASWPQCGTSQVRVTAIGKGAALGHLGVLFTLQNTSSASCRLYGYPGLLMLDSTGAPLPTTVVRAVNGSYLIARVAPHWVALAPGSVGSFDLEYGDNPVGTQVNEPYATACPAAQSAEVTLPGADDHSVVPVSMAPCGGQVLVSPVVPGSQWVGP
jgi:hypothetical protein